MVLLAPSSGRGAEPVGSSLLSIVVAIGTVGVEMGEKLAGLWPLPGGVEKYFDTALDLMAAVGGEGCARDALMELLHSRFKAEGTTARKGYIRLLTNLGWCELRGARVQLTERGGEILRTRSAELAYDDLNQNFFGIDETLRLWNQSVRSSTDLLRAFQQQHDRSWTTRNQVMFRVNWLRSLKKITTNAEGWSQPEGDPIRDAERALERVHPDAAVQVACALLLEHAIRRAHALGAARWIVSLREGRKITLSVGVFLLVRLQPGTVRIALDTRSLDAATRARIESLQQGQTEGFASNLHVVIFALPAEKVVEWTPWVTEAMESAVDAGASTVTTRTPYFRSHNESVIGALDVLLEHALPRPDYGETPEEETLPNVDLEQIGAAFLRFRADGGERFRVEVRRERARAFRAFLANPGSSPCKHLDDEFWQVERETRLDGADKTGQFFKGASGTEDHTSELSQGRMQLHGNYCWGNASSIFYPAYKDPTGRDALVLSMIEVLQLTGLSPKERIEKIDAIKGFGETVSSGLVMLAFPTEAIIVNENVRKGLRQMGFSSDSVADVQRSAAKLREHLGAADFLELDWFLFLVVNDRYGGFDRLDAASLAESAPGALASTEETPCVVVVQAPAVPYIEPSLGEIRESIRGEGLRLDDRTVRRYHLALRTRGFVILTGISGTGKTWLAEAYARAVGADHELIAVAPGWTTNEDLLGFVNPIDGRYHDTEFSEFLRRASEEWRERGKHARPFHVILDEMNLARIEHYFARFLSQLERRQRSATGEVPMKLSSDNYVSLGRNLYFVGTVNVDETTHGFADKVFDRAQVLELTAAREDVVAMVHGQACGEALLEVWDALSAVAPFAFRAINDVLVYVRCAVDIGIAWQDAFDEQMLQKVLPRIKGADPRLATALAAIEEKAERFPLTRARAAQMREQFQRHGYVSFF